jgi:tetratricopeptide (TPR) repeat protein
MHENSLNVTVLRPAESMVAAPSNPTARLIKMALFGVAIILCWLTFVVAFRWLTWLFLNSFLVSVAKAAIPSAIVGALTASITVGSYLIDVFSFKKQLRKAVNKYVFSSKRFVCIFLIVSCISFAIALFFTSVFPPPKWKVFINDSFLNGEQDGYTKAKAAMDEVSKDSPDEAKSLTQALKLFELRYVFNNRFKQLNQADIADLEGQIERDGSHDKFVKPFLIYAHAEGESLLGNLLMAQGPDKAKSAFERARAEYNDFQKIKSRAVSTRWHASAQLNRVNTYYYAQDYAAAADEYQQIANSGDDLKVIQNLVAALYMCNRFDEAITVANRALRKLENAESTMPNLYFALTENLTMCYLATTNISNATKCYENAVSKLPNHTDPGCEAAYLLALLCANTNDLTQFKLEARRVGTDVTPRHFLIFGLANLIEGHNEQANRDFHTFLGMPSSLSYSGKELAKQIENEVADTGLLKIQLVRDSLKNVK